MGGRFLKGENLFYKKLKFNHIKFKTDKSCFLSVSSDLICKFLCTYGIEFHICKEIIDLLTKVC